MVSAVVVSLFILYFQCGLLLAFTVYLHSQKGILFKKLEQLLVSAFITCLVYSVVCFPIPEFFAQFFYGLYFISFTWLLLILIDFVYEFTSYPRRSAVVRKVLITLAVVDSIILGGLSCMNKVCQVQWGTWGSGHLWQPVSFHPYFNIHLIICYLFALFSVVLFTIKISYTPRKLRNKYLSVIFSISAVILLNTLYLILKIPFDVSLLTFGFLAVDIHFYGFIHKPSNLVKFTLMTVIESMHDLIACFDMDDNCVFVNNNMKDFLRMHFPDEQFPSSDIRSLEFESFCKKTYAKWLSEHPGFRDFDDAVFKRPVKFTSNGVVRTLSVQVWKNFDKDGLYVGCFFKLNDITEELQKAEKEEHEKKLDSLSGFYRREYFMKKLRALLRENPDTNYSIICTNIIDFKIYNSVFGEEQGNEVLRQCSAMIRNARQKMELYGRISGDMYAMICRTETINEDNLLRYLKAMQDRFSNSFYKMRLQLGIYHIQNHGEPSSAICEKATLTCKANKNVFDRYIFYYEDKNFDDSLNEKQVMGRLENALQNHEFKMFLQPQVTPDGVIRGAEALIRWIDEDGVMFPPGQFIPVLEKNGAVSKVDRYIWEQAAQKLAQWKAAGFDHHISINISGKDFYYMDLYDELTGLVEKYGIAPEKLKLEITETTIIQDIGAIDELLQRLRAYGFQIEIDDFGSGYSSLGMLKDITVDYLKIDMSFLRKAKTTEEKKVWLILEEIVKLAEKLQLHTICEGVEEQSQVERLTALGCDFFQGYYFSKPVSVAAFEEQAGMNR